MEEEWSELSGGNMGMVLRRADTVRRPAGDWTPAVHRLLNHLADAGMGGVPRVLAPPDDHHELLSFIAGDVPGSPLPAWVWSEAALISSGELLGRLHAASRDADRTGPWRSPTHEPVDVICHNDVAPYNLVFVGGRAVGLIDFDAASPGPRLWDLAYLAYRLVPLTCADVGDGFDLGQRLGRLERLQLAYGQRFAHQELIDTVILRLRELADFSDRMAGELANPELHRHAGLYRRDAEQLAQPADRAAPRFGDLARMRR